MSVSGVSRARRLVEGWSANLIQIALGITQQVALVPLFLHFWTSDVLAAWLSLYAVGNLVFIADAGLQFRAINRFLKFTSTADCNGRTARLYAAMLRIYFGLVGVLVVLVLVGAALVRPSSVFGFQATPNFDTAFIAMTVGMLVTLPANLVTGLYRARGLYGRAVKLQSVWTFVSQLGQIAVIATIGSLLAVTLAYVAIYIGMTIYFLFDAFRLFPFLRNARAAQPWRWVIGQFHKAFPFAIVGAADIALLYAPVLLVGAFVSDRIAIAQWGLTRVIWGLVRALCYQTTLPLAAELGQDYAAGLKERLHSLYAHGSVLVTVLASLTVAALLSFWPDFFGLWTDGKIPYDPWLTATLLMGTSLVAPAALALSFANYSNQGVLLVRTKGLQLVVFLSASLFLIPMWGPLGAAVAIVLSDIFIQFGLLTPIIMRQTLERPVRHLVFLVFVTTVVVVFGWGIGWSIRRLIPANGFVSFVEECATWLMVMLAFSAPLLNPNFRAALIAKIPK
jgi:hypothetical protein